MRSEEPLSKILRPQGRNRKIMGSWLALTVGVWLFSLAALAWFNFRGLLQDHNREDVMDEFIVIGKAIDPNRVMPATFDGQEIEDLRGLAQVRKLGLLTANQFPVHASIGGSMGFQTELFLESVDASFLDTFVADWNWEPGQTTVPIVLSNDFLSLYNYGFAFSQGLPALSQKTIRALPIELTVNRERRFRAEVVGFTERINSILVPQRFLEVMNAEYAENVVNHPARLILKVRDPSDIQLVSFLQEHQYTVSSAQTKWSRIRTVVEILLSGLGVIASLIVGLGMLTLLLFLEVTIYQSQGNLRLLNQLGYPPKRLQKALLRFVLPWLGSALLVAFILSLLSQAAFVFFLRKIDLTASWTAAALPPLIAVVFFVVSFWLLKRSSGRSLRRISAL